ncbi:MAG: tetratricopeptide repeat protein [Planctomycetota bacterium]|jgi:tetratricopeptide (TPR) repeat protein
MATGSAETRPRTTLRHARVVFTGRLASMTRRSAADVVRRAGGQVTSGVSRRTSLLVLGMHGWPLLPDGTVSRSFRRAEQLNGRGARIRVIPEIEFLELAGRREREAEVAKSYPLAQACDLLGLAPDTLQRWEALGLVRSVEGRYDFQDLVSLRTIAGLLARGVTAETIATSMHGLARVLDTGRPLAQLTIVEQSGALLAEIGDALVAPDGQLLLNFDPAPDGPAVLTLTETKQPVGLSADEWLERGVRLEEQERHEEALEAYRRALAAQPGLAAAHFNLGNALRALDRLDGAEEHLRMAVASDPDLAVGWYNLADVLEEEGRLDEAIECLRTAVGVDAAYADAHYNLALFCEEAGRPSEARRHWRAYLRLDPDSPWAATARRHLQAADE